VSIDTDPRTSPGPPPEDGSDAPAARGDGDGPTPGAGRRWWRVGPRAGAGRGAGVDDGADVPDDEAGRPLLLAALIAVVVLPVLAVGVTAALHPWYPAGDWADVALGAIEVGTDHTPLVGVYSRYGWNHPGPMMFWLYALPYRLLGQSFAGMILAASLLNAASVGGAVALAWRRGRVVLAAVVVVPLALVVHTLGPALLRDPWNPWVTVLPFGLLVVATWAAVEGDRAALPVVAVVGSFLSQTHIGFVPLVGLLAVVATVGFLARRGDRRPVLIGLAVLVLCWSPVLVHVATGATTSPASSSTSPPTRSPRGCPTPTGSPRWSWAAGDRGWVRPSRACPPAAGSSRVPPPRCWCRWRPSGRRWAWPGGAAGGRLRRCACSWWWACPSSPGCLP
jgi:hypothetical protein